MSDINGKHASIWINTNHPQDGLFRVYWKNPEQGGATLDSEEGEGLKYEWEYKDGQRADGISKGWFPNGQMKSIHPWKDGEKNGLYNAWYENGQKGTEMTWKDGKQVGLWTTWYENGQKKGEGNYKDGELDGLHTWWYRTGQKKYEGTYNNGKVELETLRYKNGKKRELTFKDGKLVGLDIVWSED